MAALCELHMTVLQKLMSYIVDTAEERGLVPKPNHTWDESVDHQFVIHVRSNLVYATNTNDTGAVFLMVECVWKDTQSLFTVRRRSLLPCQCQRQKEQQE